MMSRQLQHHTLPEYKSKIVQEHTLEDAEKSMVVCGVDIKGKEAILSLVTYTDEISHLKSETKKLKLLDHKNTESLNSMLQAIRSFSSLNSVEFFILKSKQSKGHMASGASVFKIETLFQLSGTDVTFVSPQKIASFAKNSNHSGIPSSILTYQRDAYLAAACFIVDRL